MSLFNKFPAKILRNSKDAIYLISMDSDTVINTSLEEFNQYLSSLYEYIKTIDYIKVKVVVPDLFSLLNEVFFGDNSDKYFVEIKISNIKKLCQLLKKIGVEVALTIDYSNVVSLSKVFYNFNIEIKDEDTPEQKGKVFFNTNTFSISNNNYLTKTINLENDNDEKNLTNQFINVINKYKKTFEINEFVITNLIQSSYKIVKNKEKSDLAKKLIDIISKIKITQRIDFGLVEDNETWTQICRMKLDVFDYKIVHLNSETDKFIRNINLYNGVDFFILDSLKFLNRKEISHTLQLEELQQLLKFIVMTNKNVGYTFLFKYKKLPIKYLIKNIKFESHINKYMKKLIILRNELLGFDKRTYISLKQVLNFQKNINIFEFKSDEDTFLMVQNLSTTQVFIKFFFKFKYLKHFKIVKPALEYLETSISKF